MNKDVFYVCDNTDVIDGAITTFYAPLFEDFETSKQIPHKEIYGVWGLMDRFTQLGERTYYKINLENIDELLVKAIGVEVTKGEYNISFKYLFEDGSDYEGHIDVEDDRDDDINSLIDIAKEAMTHVFFLKCELTSDMMDFYTEQWG